MGYHDAMPRYPGISRNLLDIGGSLYSSLTDRLAAYSGELYPFHVGDTWLEPAEGCRMEDLRVEQHPGMHRYAPPRGDRKLIEAVVERTRARTGAATQPGDVLITTGATGALGAVMGAIVEPGDEVLILAPYWPLIPGIVRCFHGTPRPVTALHDDDSPERLLAGLRAARTEKTVAVYLSTPNNPTGSVLPGSWVETLVEWAASEELWIVSDEVYEDYVYDGRHTYARPLSPKRTFSAHSFSKAFGMAGNRCGYVVGPAGRMDDVCKVSTHAFYSAPTAGQLAAARALDGRGDAWIAEVREQYRDTGTRAAARLGIAAPQGSTFLFLDVRQHLDQRGLLGFLEDCADRGLFVAPGGSFGDYPTHVRLCYTAAAPDVVDRGIEALAALLGR
jgi:N-succinyldiaminopimelate aminotransferase